MVKLLIPFTLVLSASAGAELRPSDVKFQIEFTKAEVYAGEPVTAHFVLYSKEDVLDVEVAKFPEFRGYWSENLALRQGPMPMLPDFNSKTWKKSVVGSYLINSMIEEKVPVIKPMKLVVRELQHPPNTEPSELILYSEGTPLKIKPLPPVPPTLGGKFSGGVGRFTFQVERTPVLFRQDEPTNLRFLLSGEGNFREINDVFLPDMEEVEILSRKSYSQGSGQYYSKSFEITLALHSDKNLNFPAFAFHYFDPILGRYQSIQIPEIPFLRAPDPEGGPPKEGPVDFGTPYRDWTAHSHWVDSAAFWTLHGWLILFSLGYLWIAGGWGARLSQALRRRTEDPWRLRLAAVQSALGSGDLDGFLGQADSLAFDLLSRRIPNAVTRSELLRRGAAHIKEERLREARALFDAWGKRAYSPQKPLPPDPQPLLAGLQALVREAA